MGKLYFNNYNSLGYTAENEPALGCGVFRWEKCKKGYGFLSYHCRIPIRHCLTYACSALRELAMPAQIPRSHGAISPPFLIALISRFHPWRLPGWLAGWQPVVYLEETPVARQIKAACASKGHRMQYEGGSQEVAGHPTKTRDAT